MISVIWMYNTSAHECWIFFFRKYQFVLFDPSYHGRHHWYNIGSLHLFFLFPPISLTKATLTISAIASVKKARGQTIHLSAAWRLFWTILQAKGIIMVSASTRCVCELQTPTSSAGNTETGYWRFALLTGTSFQIRSVISVKPEPHYSSASCLLLNQVRWEKGTQPAAVCAGPGASVLRPTAPRRPFSVCLVVCECLTDYHKFFKALWNSIPQMLQ